MASGTGGSSWRLWYSVGWWLFNLALALPTTAWGLSSDDVACGGRVEVEAWRTWQSVSRPLLEDDLLRQRLVGRRDTYALYDFQSYTQNIVAMARRCHRMGRLREIAALVEGAYASLEARSFPAKGRGWVCRGGAICTARNGLLDNEVTLCSLQFLGLATALASALAADGSRIDAQDIAFIRETLNVALEHLLHWATESVTKSIVQAAQAAPNEVIDGSSKLLFTDKPLWLIGVYAEVAGVLAAIGDRDLKAVSISAGDVLRLQRHYQALIHLFFARISLENATKDGERLGTVADLDRGYWRLYSDNRFAAYTGEQKPVLCETGSGGVTRPKAVVDPATVPLLSSAGWDISHARRLVHVLDALDRNRTAIAAMWGSRDFRVPLSTVQSTFANSLLVRIWNGDSNYPLFSNYFSGANGWYRVAYDNGTGQCREGTPPYALTSSFPTGGYISWSKYHARIGQLGSQLYRLYESTHPADVAFVEHYYPDFSGRASPRTVALSRLMFLPTLVGGSDAQLSVPGARTFKH